jgi:SAM-dependent methyltransferase
MTSEDFYEVDLTKWGHPAHVTLEQRELWSQIETVWKSFAGHIPSPSLDIGAARRKGRTVSIDPFPRGPIDTRGVGEQLPFRDDTFSSVVLESVLKHVIAPESVLTEALRVLRPGSLIFLTSPVNSVDHHKHSFTSSQLLDIIEAAGFLVIRKRGVGFSFRLLHRLMKRLSHRWYVSLSVPVSVCSVLFVVAAVANP